VLPQHRHRLALRIVVDAGSANKRCLTRPARLLDAFDKPATLPKVNELARFGQCGRYVQSPVLGEVAAQTER
jgi:hypothetical protein